MKDEIKKKNEELKTMDEKCKAEVEMAQFKADRKIANLRDAYKKKKAELEKIKADYEENERIFLNENAIAKKANDKVKARDNTIKDLEDQVRFTFALTCIV